MSDWKWKFYALTKGNKLVMGFNFKEDAWKYCSKYNFKIFTANGLKNKKIKPDMIENWVYDDEVPEQA